MSIHQIKCSSAGAIDIFALSCFCVRCDKDCLCVSPVHVKMLPNSGNNRTTRKRNVSTAKPSASSKRAKKDQQDWMCLVCCELWSGSQPREKWIQCQNCEQWAHLECTSLSKPLYLTFATSAEQFASIKLDILAAT